MKHHDCFINTAHGYKIVMTLKATSGGCWLQERSQRDRELMYLWQSCPHHPSYVLPPLWNVRIVLIKSWREWQQQWPVELWEADKVMFVRLWVLPRVSVFINLMCSFVFFHLATYTLKLIAPQDFVLPTMTFYSLDESMLTSMWHHLQSGPRGITLSPR